MNCDEHMGFKRACEQCAADRIETIEFLAEHRETWAPTTVQRAGFPSLWAAERFLNRAGRGDLVIRLKREPEGAFV